MKCPVPDAGDAMGNRDVGPPDIGRASLPMLVTLSGITTLVRLVQP